MGTNTSDTDRAHKLLYDRGWDNLNADILAYFKRGDWELVTFRACRVASNMHRVYARITLGCFATITTLRAQRKPWRCT